MDKNKSALMGSALEKGTVLKNGKKSYVIDKVLGTGGFGITYKAYCIGYDGNIKRKYYYAIKEYFQNGCWRDNLKVCYADSFKADFEEGFSDFKSEANKLLSMVGKTRNIVPVNECFQQNNTIYYVMEYLNGDDLEQVVPKGSGISEARALSLLIPIIKAVNILHDNKAGDRIMHLDIKPDNIVLHHDTISEETYPVLIDFGAAMRFDKEGKPKTRKLNQKGTVGYAPPEQFQPIEQFDARIDVYALGATLFYLLTGIHPKSSFDISDSYILETLPGNISERTKNAVKNAMQKDKGNRFSSVKEFLDALEDSYYLPVFSILSSPHQKYKILSVENENDYSITYEGCISYSLDDTDVLSNEKNQTKVAYNYLIHEYFVRNFCKRSGSEVTITATSPSNEDSLIRFKSDVDKAGISDSSPYITADNGIVEKEMFATNGTYYYCYKIINNQRMLRIPKIPKILTKHWKQLAIVSLFVAITASAITKYGEIGSFLDGLIPTESEKLTNAILKEDFERLRKFADKDSARAFAPLAGMYMEMKDTLNAYKTYKKASDNIMVKQIEDALMKPYNEQISSMLNQYSKGDNSVKDTFLIQAIAVSEKGEAIASKHGFTFNRIDLSTTINKRFKEWVEAGDSRKFPVQIRISNYQQALRLKGDSDVRNKLNALLVQTSSQQQSSSSQSPTQSVSTSNTDVEISDDQKYEVAIKNNNWAELKRLADKGYSKAYIPLARHYLRSSSTHAEAEKYALKAINNNTDSTKMIIDILDSYGYYDDKKKPI